MHPPLSQFLKKTNFFILQSLKKINFWLFKVCATRVHPSDCRKTALPLKCTLEYEKSLHPTTQLLGLSHSLYYDMYEGWKACGGFTYKKQSSIPKIGNKSSTVVNRGRIAGITTHGQDSSITIVKNRLQRGFLKCRNILIISLQIFQVVK